MTVTPMTPHSGRTLALLLLATAPLGAQRPVLPAATETQIAKLEQQVIAWRRDIHQHPELGNREHRTAELVAKHLRSLGMEVQTGVAHTGVVGILRGGKPGPVVLLRADMDGLPVTETSDLPFKSVARTMYNGQEVGVSHACGHDTHVAILMGVASAMSAMRKDLQGTVKFVFQPAEEGPPQGEEGGAEMMVRQGVLASPTVDAAFALHINASEEVHHLSYASGGMYASADDFRITVTGKQSHGGYPWQGVDPIVASAHIITALQTITSRNVKLLDNPAVVTVGMIRGGIRSNIIPTEVEMVGTLRALSASDRELIHRRVREIATNVAEGMGATATVQIPVSMGYPVTQNDPALTARMIPILEAVAGPGKANSKRPVTGAEDFAFIAEKVPSVYISLGGRPANVTAAKAPSHHTPEFFVDDSGLNLGVRALTAMSLHYMATHPKATGR
jgi:amidohydrolase